MPRTWLRLWPCLLALLGGTTPALAIEASNVLVLYNLASPDGAAIANYYAQVHPGVNLLGISGIGTSNEISASTWLNTVRPQVMSALSSSTDVIVTTKGMPLRINVTQSAPTAPWPNLPTYTDPQGNSRSILQWKQYSSVESELTAIDRVSSWEMMGDQSYAMPGHFTVNPYYNSTASFNHASLGTRLSARLDGFTTSDVIASIDRAQNAFVGPANSPGGPFHFVVDNDPTKTYAPTMAALANNVLGPAGLPLTYDNTLNFVNSAPGPVLGYVSHGIHQASTPGNYILGGLNFSLADGAVFQSWESYNAASFNAGGNWAGQGLVGEWLQKGGTAGVGTVQEPGASPANITNEDQMFRMLLQGKTWAEAAWSATRQLSYVNTVVGDPLMTWKTLLPGDVNRDGVVDALDLQQLGANWGREVTPGGSGWTAGDLNGDGIIDFNDLGMLGSSWGQVSSWANRPAGMAETAFPFSILFQSPAFSTPEPASAALLAVGMVALVATAWKRRQRQVRSR